MISQHSVASLGFSTGALHPQYTVPQALEIFRQHHITTVELGIDILDTPDELDPDLIQSFSYVSLHAPKFPYSLNAGTKKLFNKIERIHAIRPLDLVVIHPDPVVNFAAFHDLPFPVAFENMDHNKPSHHTAPELKRILDVNPAWKLVLDVNHVYTNDKTMALAKPFYDLLGDRIAEIHVSGYKVLHDPLFETQQPEIVRAIKNWEAPIIIESQLRAPENLVRERTYIESIIS